MAKMKRLNRRISSTSHPIHFQNAWAKFFDRYSTPTVTDQI